MLSNEWQQKLKSKQAEQKQNSNEKIIGQT